MNSGPGRYWISCIPSSISIRQPPCVGNPPFLRQRLTVAPKRSFTDALKDQRDDPSRRGRWSTFASSSVQKHWIQIYRLYSYVSPPQSGSNPAQWYPSGDESSITHLMSEEEDWHLVWRAAMLATMRPNPDISTSSSKPRICLAWVGYELSSLL